MAYPTSADTFPTITSGTYQDDVGFEADVLLNRAFAAIVALEAKAGNGASTPVANALWRGTGTGTSAWGQLTDADVTPGALSIASLAGGISAGYVTTATTAGPTTTSGTLVDLAQMSLSFTTAGGYLIIGFSGTFASSSAGATVAADLVINGSPIQRREGVSATANATFCLSHAFLTSVGAASIGIKIQWLTTAGTATANGVERMLYALELRR